MHVPLAVVTGALISHVAVEPTPGALSDGRHLSSDASVVLSRDRYIGSDGWHWRGFDD